MERTSILGRKKPLALDVGVDIKEITSFESLQWRLDPNVNSSLLGCAGFHKVAWSPLNCDIKGRYSIVLFIFINQTNYVCLDVLNRILYSLFSSIHSQLFLLILFIFFVF